MVARLAGTVPRGAARFESIESLKLLIEPVVQSFGCELWGIDFRAYKSSALLRVYIDKVSGVTVDDCSKVSYQLSGVLDVENPIDVPYTLEVSSPGLERPLLTAAHFERYVGERVKVRLDRPLDGRRNFVGTVARVHDNTVDLNVEDEGKVVEIPLEWLSRGRLLVDFDAVAQGAKK